MDAKELRRANLRKLVEQHETIAELGRQVDTDPSYLSQIINQSPSRTQTGRSMGHKLARKIEIQLDLPPGWMDADHGRATLEVGEETQPYGDNVRRPAATHGQHYPVISWVQAGQWSETVDPVSTGEADDWMPAPPGVKVGNRAFWLEVMGLSMVNPSGGQGYPPGSLILVDPDDRDCITGRLVIAKLDDTDETTFKRLNREGSRLYLEPLNPQYPVMEIASDCQIIGRVRSAILPV